MEEFLEAICKSSRNFSNTKAWLQNGDTQRWRSKRVQNQGTSLVQAAEKNSFNLIPNAYKAVVQQSSSTDLNARISFLLCNGDKN